jgi:hypothetical protein
MEPRDQRTADRSGRDGNENTTEERDAEKIWGAGFVPTVEGSIAERGSGSALPFLRAPADFVLRRLALFQWAGDGGGTRTRPAPP